MTTCPRCTCEKPTPGAIRCMNCYLLNPETPTTPSAPADWPHAFCPHGVSPASMCAKCARANEPTAPEFCVRPNCGKKMYLGLCDLHGPKPTGPTSDWKWKERPHGYDVTIEPTEPTSYEQERDAKAEEYVREGDCEVTDTYMAHEETYRVGYDAGYAKAQTEWPNSAVHKLNEKLTAELAAYKTAKAENDERFQLEVGQLRALTEADKLEIDGLREENASYRARLEKAEQDYRTEQIINAEMTGYKAERDRAVKALERALSIGEFSATERAEIERVLKQGAQNE